MTYLLLLPFLVYFMGLVGYSIISKNLIGVVVFLELMLLALSLLYVVAGFTLDDWTGSIVALYMLPLAGGESAVAIALLVAYYPTNYNLKILFMAWVSLQSTFIFPRPLFVVIPH